MIPPDVSNTYMALGYAVVVLILFGMVGYFANRARRLRAELTLLEDLEREDMPAKPKNDQKAQATEHEKEMAIR